jgi:hypothetical protein
MKLLIDCRRSAPDRIQQAFHSISENNRPKHPCGQATSSSQNLRASQKASSLPFPLVKEKEGNAILETEKIA